MLIDEAIILQENTPNSWTNFLQQMQTFKDAHDNGLEWESLIPPSNQVIFLDLTMTIESDRQLSTKAFQKPMNLYLHRPPSST